MKSPFLYVKNIDVIISKFMCMANLRTKLTIVSSYKAYSFEVKK